MSESSTTIRLASHLPQELSGDRQTTALQLLERSCGEEQVSGCQGVVQTSFLSFNADIIASANGFYESIYHAYSNNHNLVLRPDDVWFAILAQLGFYLHARNPNGGKNVGSIDFQSSSTNLTARMLFQSKRNAVDVVNEDWIVPEFTTTIESDRIVASVLMLGALHEDVTHRAVRLTPEHPEGFGIPSVTLLGEKRDWERIQQRITKLRDFGEEPKEFEMFLGPIIRYIVKSFDDHDSTEVKDFWDNTIKQVGRYQNALLSGWITAFFFWDKKGKRMFKSPEGKYLLDGVEYLCIGTSSFTSAHTRMKVKVRDQGEEFRARVIAGSVGMKISSSNELKEDSDTLQPESGWWMIKVGDDGEA
ncbi:uncharacterized protein K489DRAFT_413711 [Dissoconium aciculare CBS 342.82]|uniref:Uncharacterized protein n=1 Tax=Dissoconium aciculare CBS 342.82 TaxID=1314786 RepID=A0A6J3LRF1_9PEZI|nr:uncharacterized protein K489DRAFT_413711 [Dissoconium aciculare CBS 342.82]KAF1818416.1 hypothetical protein K489DRAFT_413711 [Dissoconium aciculare CBS 342.82]